MIDFLHEFARERHQDLLAEAERYGLGRSAADRGTALHRLKSLLRIGIRP
jgi:hypothetical protein